MRKRLRSSVSSDDVSTLVSLTCATSCKLVLSFSGPTRALSRSLALQLRHLLGSFIYIDYLYLTHYPYSHSPLLAIFPLTFLLSIKSLCNINYFYFYILRTFFRLFGSKLHYLHKNFNATLSLYCIFLTILEQKIKLDDRIFF
jgi:hypothetical protein